MSSSTERRCPSCGGVMRRGVQAETVVYQGHSLAYQQPGWHCENGDDGVLEGSDNDFHDAALHEVMARAKGSPISPLLIRAAREVVGVSQREAGRVFGGGPTAFHKYETAKAVPSEGMARLLRLALEHPELFARREDEAAGWPSTNNSGLLRKASGSDPRLRELLASLYPEAAE